VHVPLAHVLGQPDVVWLHAVPSGNGVVWHVPVVALHVDVAHCVALLHATVSANFVKRNDATLSVNSSPP